MVVVTRSWKVLFSVFLGCLLLPGVGWSILANYRALLNTVVTRSRGHFCTDNSNLSIIVVLVDDRLIRASLVHIEATVTRDILYVALTVHQRFSL